MTDEIKVLILSCGTGGGHNSAALAVQESLRDKGVHADFIEYLDIINKKVRNGVNKLYINSTKMNGKIFKRIYRLGELYSKTKITSPVYVLNKLNKKKLHKYIQEKGYTYIITTHLFAAQALTEIKKEHNIHFAQIATDYVCIPFWEETNPDYFIIPSEDLKEEFISKGIEEEKLLPYGIPVSKAYTRNIDKERTKKSLKLEIDKNYILILTGSMGFGSIEKMLKELMQKVKDYILILTGSMGFGNIVQLIKELIYNISDVIFIVSCGNNKKMLETLNREFNKEKRIIALPYTDKVSEYIKISEIVLSKPGGLTTTEIAVSRKPFIHTMPIPGCENYNAQYFNKRKMSIKCDTLNEVIENTKKLYENKNMQEEMIKNQERNIRRDTADKITELILSLK